MEFFNRSEETLKLSSLFQFPTWTIILGPPSSGKTALVNHVVNQQRKDGSHMFIPVMIDFRECTPTSGDDIRDMLIRSLNRSSLIREIFSKLDIEISAALSGLGIKLSKSPRSQKISLLDHIKRLAMKKRPKESVNLEMFLAILKEALLGFRKLILRRGETHTAPLVLVFDEVNVLRELEDKHVNGLFMRYNYQTIVILGSERIYSFHHNDNKADESSPRDFHFFRLFLY